MRSLIVLLVSLLPYVNPMIGTGGRGHTSPAACFPFGMMQLGPDTRPDFSSPDGCSGYNYADSLIFGFSHTHLSGTGEGDWCDILVMPATGISNNVDSREYASPFSHSTEVATPGYYEVYLEKPKVLARMTVGQRAGIHEYTFNSGDEPMLVIDLKHGDRLLGSSLDMDRSNPYLLYGHRRSSRWARDHSVYFVMEFNRPVASCKMDSTGAVLHFRPSRRNVLNVRVGISSVSVENAKLNLFAENIESFDDLKLYAEDEWESFLNTLKCPYEDKERKTIFYTALYHCGIHPSLYCDTEGQYTGKNGTTTFSMQRDRYTVYSLWDTFRAQHPLLRKIAPELASDMISSMFAIFQENGKLPVWELSGWETNTMIGYHSAPVIADAVVNGVPNLFLKELLAALVTSSNVDEFGMASFRINGCVLGDDEDQSVSRTLEYAYDDWCVAQVAAVLMESAETDEEYDKFAKAYDAYMTSCQYWRNVFDPVTGYMRPRINGRWATPFDPRENSIHYTEANAAQYSFFVPHDFLGLMRAMGGPSKFCSRLDKLVAEGLCDHSNEPSHHIPYLYALAGKPEKTKALVDSIMTTMYSTKPDGLCGNDDCGQMSAWYILSALGEYPVCPGNTGLEKTWVPKTIVVNPVFEMDADVITDSPIIVSVSNIDTGCKAFYRIGDEEFREYRQPFTVSEPCVLEAYSQSPDGTKSFVNRSVISKRPEKVSVEGGPELLIDGVRGMPDWKAGGWWAVTGKDFEIVLDLQQMTKLSEAGIGFCHDTRSRIWAPEEVEFLASTDGVNFVRLANQTFSVSEHQNKSSAIEARIKTKGFYARYVKFSVKSRKSIPEWHYASGFPCSVLVDEIWAK